MEKSICVMSNHNDVIRVVLADKNVMFYDNTGYLEQFPAEQLKEKLRLLSYRIGEGDRSYDIEDKYWLVLILWVGTLTDKYKPIYLLARGGSCMNIGKLSSTSMFHVAEGFREESGGRANTKILIDTDL